MIGRRAIVGLSLLSALLLCAFAAQTASATTAAKNTTAFTCVKGGGDNDFKDEHCDEFVGKGNGEYGHVLITEANTKLSVTNAKTANKTTEAAPTILKGTIFGVKSEIVCKTVTGEGTLTNSEPEAKVHKVTGTVTAKFTSCVANKPAGCKVKEPITVSSNTEGVEEIQGAKEKEKGEKGTEMGLEFKPTEGTIFSSVTLEGCLLAGTYNTTGTAIGTGTPLPSEKFSGTTNVFTNAMTKETLKLAGNPAEVSSTTTVNMEGGNPIALTTVT